MYIYIYILHCELVHSHLFLNKVKHYVLILEYYNIILNNARGIIIAESGGHYCKGDCNIFIHCNIFILSSQLK